MPFFLRNLCAIAFVLLANLTMQLLPASAQFNPLYNARTGVDWSGVTTSPVNFPVDQGLTGWRMGGDPSGYRLIFQPHGFLGGKPCLLLQAVQPRKDQMQSITQGFSAVNYRGERVCLSGWMKTSGAQHVQFGLRLDLQSGVESVFAPEVNGTTPWKKYRLVLDVPIDAQGVLFAPGNIYQSGELWLADMRLDVVNKSTQLTKDIENFCFPGDTQRIEGTWTLTGQTHFRQSLTQDEAIINDPKASKEEVCTALEGVAYNFQALGNRDTALKSLNEFDAKRKNLNIDPEVITDAARTRIALQKNSGQKYPLEINYARSLGPIPTLDLTLVVESNVGSTLRGIQSC